MKKEEERVIAKEVTALPDTTKDEKSLADYQIKLIDTISRISTDAKTNNRIRFVMTLIVTVAVLSILFTAFYFCYKMLIVKQDEYPLAAIEIRSLNRIEVLSIELPVLYERANQTDNTYEIIATTGYGVYTVDLNRAEIEETARSIDITVPAPELTTVDIYSNQNEVIVRGSNEGLKNAFYRIISGDTISDGFKQVAQRNVALKEKLRETLESDEYVFLRSQAENQAITVISNFVHSIDAYPNKRDVSVRFLAN